MCAPTRSAARDLRRGRTLPERPEGPAFSEFALIARDLAPLAGPDSRGLADDVAVFGGFAVTADTIACGVHFLPGDPLDTVARKAVRVNVSDIVAKGCRPVAMMLACAWHEDATPDDHAVFAAGLSDDLDAYGIALLGGDTTRLPAGQGPVFTVTLLGRPCAARVPTRGGAAPGDRLYVSGTIGDGWLGLGQLTGALDAGEEAARVVRAYRLPAPPTAAADAIAAAARAALDVSDGLVADARHLAAASRVAVRIEAARVPLSGAGAAFVAGGGAFASLITGGDDYQALVAVPPEKAAAFEAAARAAGAPFSPIGVCLPGSGVSVVDADGRDVTPSVGGFEHGGSLGA